MGIFGTKKELRQIRIELEQLTAMMERLLDRIDGGGRTTSRRSRRVEPQLDSSPAVPARTPARRRSAKTAPEISPLAGAPEFLQNFLNKRGINIKALPGEDAADSVIDELSLTLGEQYGVLAPLLANIKRALQGTGGVRETLSGYDQADLSLVTRFCTRLHRYAFLEQYRYVRTPQSMVTARVNKMPAAQKFFNGQWLERFVLQKVQAVYEQFRRESSLSLRMETLVNPHIILQNGNNFELDVLVSFDNQVYWIEAKSGDYQTHVAKYSNFSKTLQLDPRHAMLVLTDIPEEECGSLSSLYPLSIYNLDIFEKHFLALVRDDFAGKSPAPEAGEKKSASGRRRAPRRRGTRKASADAPAPEAPAEEPAPARPKTSGRRRSTARKKPAAQE